MTSSIPAEGRYRVIRLVNGSRAVAIGMEMSLEDAVRACLGFAKLIEIEYGGKDEFYIEPDC